MAKKKLSGIHYSQWEFADADYLDKLSDAEFEWYQQFNKEYYSANFEDGVKPLHKNPKAAQREAWQKQNESKRSVWYESKRVGMPMSQHKSKISYSDLDLEEMHDKLGPEKAREVLADRLKEAVFNAPEDQRTTIIARFMAQYDKLRTIYRKEYYTRNPNGKNQLTKSKKKGKK